MDIGIVVIVGLYVVLSSAVGIVLTRKNKTIQSFLIAKEELPIWITMPFLLSCLFAGSYTAGNAGDSYTLGLRAGYPILCMAFGVLTFFPLIRVYRGFANTGRLSVPEVFAARFDQKSRRVLLVFNTLLYAAFFAVQPSAVSTILSPMFKVNYELMTWICTAIFIIMALSGFKGLAYINIFHGAVMFAGIILTSVFAVRNVGGLVELINKAGAEKFDFGSSLGAMKWPTLIGYAVSACVCMYASSSVPTTVVSSKTESIAKKTTAIIGIIVIPFTVMISLIGISASVALPDLENSKTALYAMANVLGPFFSITASMAVIAAVFSSASPYLIFCASGLTRDLFVPIKKDATSKQQIMFSRICIVIIGVLGNFLCVRASSILSIAFGFTQIQSVCGLVLIIAVYWKKVDGNAAFWAMVTGGSLSALWYFLGSPFGLIPAWLGLIPGALVLVILTLLAKKPVSDGYIEMQKAIATCSDNTKAELLAEADKI